MTAWRSAPVPFGRSAMSAARAGRSAPARAGRLFVAMCALAQAIDVERKESAVVF